MGKQKQNKISNETNHKYQNINQKVNRWLVGPAGPHFAILGGCPEYVRTARTLVGKLSMVRPHKVIRLLRKIVSPAQLCQLSTESHPLLPLQNTEIIQSTNDFHLSGNGPHGPAGKVREKSRGLLLVCLRFLQLERTS